MTQSHKYVLISNLIKELNTSESTIRRDIKDLEDQGLVLLSQGSLIWKDDSNVFRENVYYREIQNADIKERISLEATKIIEPNETIFIDTGTTMLQLAKNLDEGIPLTVITNDLEIALELENKFNITTIILGGVVKRGTHTTTNDFLSNFLDNIHFQKSFFSPAGISEDGFSFLNIQAMAIRKKVVSQSEKLIMVADSSKFGKRSSVRGFSFSDCDMLFTESCPDSWRTIIGNKTKIVICQK